MLFENFSVKRIIIHEVHRRRDDNTVSPPTYGQEILNLNKEAGDFFKERVIAAVGSNSQSMDMEIMEPLESESALNISRAVVSANETGFISESKRFADKLTSAQMYRNIPGGVLVVFTGQIGYPARDVVGLIKAETHSGFRYTEKLQVQYLQDLFLGPQTKLYKIGIFAHDGKALLSDAPKGWTTRVYDSLMTSSNREAAAQYFYESFLGCAIPVNSAQQTKRFFEETRDFINKLDIDDEEKSDLFSSLYTYIKVDKSSTIETAQFSKQYLGPELKEDYQNYMKQVKFPSVAIKKDTSDMQHYLRKRKISFSRNIQLIAPPEAFQELVAVKSIERGEDQEGAGSKWTQITVRDHIRSLS